MLTTQGERLLDDKLLLLNNPLDVDDLLFDGCEDLLLGIGEDLLAGDGDFRLNGDLRVDDGDRRCHLDGERRCLRIDDDGVSPSSAMSSTSLRDLDVLPLDMDLRRRLDPEPWVDGEQTVVIPLDVALLVVNRDWRFFWAFF